jgi:SAM-dependent methyltransferase
MKITDVQAQDTFRSKMSSADFTHWEKRYDAPDYLYGTEPNAFLKSQANLLPKTGNALAVADGEGRNGVWLAEQGLDVLSIDFSPKAQAKAKALAERRGVAVRFVAADVTAWDWPTTEFDVIAVIFIQFCGPPERRRIFAGIRQALKPGGLLLLQGYRTEQIAYGTGGPSEVENLYTEAMLREEFGTFDKLDIRVHDSVISEGLRHSGMAAVVDLVGWK